MDDEMESESFWIPVETFDNLMMLREFTGEDIGVLVHKAVVLYLQCWFRDELEGTENGSV